MASTKRSSIPTVVVIIVVIVGLGLVTFVAAGIALPALRRARTNANEAAAVSSLRAINSAQVAFAANCGDGFYAASLAGLGRPPAGSQAGFLTADLAVDPAMNSGYTFRLTSQPGQDQKACNGAAVTMAYFVSAEPIHAGSMGPKYFGTNAGMTIFQSPSPVEPVFAGAPSNAVPIQQ